MPERYQKEIEEILRQAGDLSSDARPRRSQDGLFRLIRLQLSQSFGGKRWSLTPGRVMLVGVVLTLAGLVLGSAIPGITGLLAWGGLVLFIVGYGLFFVTPTNKTEKRWRGRPVDYQGESLWDRLSRRLKRR